jgi:hypothetical protein
MKPLEPYKYIFISYCHEDSAYVSKLTKALAEKDLPYWFDKEIRIGTKWEPALLNHLDSCGVFVLIMTPDSFESEWVCNELTRAKSNETPIFPLLLEGDRPWPSVQALQYVDVRNHELPPEDCFEQFAKHISHNSIPVPKNSVIPIPQTHINDKRVKATLELPKKSSELEGQGGISHVCPNCKKLTTINVADAYFDDLEEYRALRPLFKPPEKVDIPSELPYNKPHNEVSRGGLVMIASGIGFIILEQVVKFLFVDLDIGNAGSYTKYVASVYEILCGWGPVIICVIIAIVLFIRTGIANSRARDDSIAQRIHIKKRREEAIRKNTQFNNAMRKYRNLFYCSVCDTVFNPETGEYKNIGKMDQLLE